MSSDVSESPRARLHEARRALYRDAILDAAEAEFAEHGYEAAKVQAVAERAGVSLATFYATFPKKEDVLRGVLRLRLDGLMQRVGQLLVTAKDPFDRLRCGIEGYLRFHMAHPAFLRLELRERVPWGTTDELRTPEQTRAWRAGLELLVATFRQCIELGWFIDEDPEHCARTATAMSQVRLALWVDRGMVEPPDRVALLAMQQFVRCFARMERMQELLDRLEKTPLPA